jgi:hypothetical protein
MTAGAVVCSSFFVVHGERAYCCLGQPRWRDAVRAVRHGACCCCSAGSACGTLHECSTVGGMRIQPLCTAAPMPTGAAVNKPLTAMLCKPQTALATAHLAVLRPAWVSMVTELMATLGIASCVVVVDMSADVYLAPLFMHSAKYAFVRTAKARTSCACHGTHPSRMSGSKQHRAKAAYRHFQSNTHHNMLRGAQPCRFSRSQTCGMHYKHICIMHAPHCEHALSFMPPRLVLHACRDLTPGHHR